MKKRINKTTTVMVVAVFLLTFLPYVQQSAMDGTLFTMRTALPVLVSAFCAGAVAATKRLIDN